MPNKLAEFIGKVSRAINNKFFSIHKKYSLSTFKQHKKTSYIFVSFAIVTIVIVLLFLGIFGSSSEKIPVQEPPIPSVSIGCDEVLWKNTEASIRASTSNIDKPVFQWSVDGKDAGNSLDIKRLLDMGEHDIILNVSFGNQTLQSKKSIIVIDSVDKVSVSNSQASKNRWGFQTTYDGRGTYVTEVQVSVDSSPPEPVNPCGSLSSKPLPAGSHSWQASYQGKNIASGTFNLAKVSEMKIANIEVAPKYTAGDTVSGKIILENTGTVAIRGFEIKTDVVNHKFEWMGEKAKKEFYDRYDADIAPGILYEIPIVVKIPEKVSGVRPSGSYTITVSLVLNGKTIETRDVNTEVV
jgi:hypothetical protein